eukprot:5389609-Amphidinium_carterae.1
MRHVQVSSKTKWVNRDPLSVYSVQSGEQSRCRVACLTQTASLIDASDTQLAALGLVSLLYFGLSYPRYRSQPLLQKR